MWTEGCIRSMEQDLSSYFSWNSFKNPLFVFAMEQEASSYFSTFKVLFTGLGKLNAAIALQEALQHSNHDIVINLGTAGSKNFTRGAVVCCKGFIERDMNVEALGFKPFQTPFADPKEYLLPGLQVADLPSAICGTGDSFVAGEYPADFQLVDMEGYALALVCHRKKLPLLSLKYISDGADDSAAVQWSRELPTASQELERIMSSIIGSQV